MFDSWSNQPEKTNYYNTSLKSVISIFFVENGVNMSDESVGKQSLNLFIYIDSGLNSRYGQFASSRQLEL